MKRVDLIDIILCGLLAYAVTFVVFCLLGGSLDASPKFFATLLVAVLLWNGLIHCHPTNPDCPK